MKNISFLFFLIIYIHQAFSQEFNGEEIFTLVELMPVFPGCETKESEEQINLCTNANMYHYVTDSLKYANIDNKIAGEVVVYVKFVINEKGLVEKEEIVRGSSEEYNAEALRVVRALPTFIPGNQRGRNVKVQYTIPVRFEQFGMGDRKNDLNSEIEDPILNWEDGNLYRYIAIHTKYPAAARDNQMTGTIYVEYTINKSGQVENAHSVYPSDDALAKESIRVINSTSGMWTPGKVDGKVEAINYQIPVRFSMTNTKDETYYYNQGVSMLERRKYKKAITEFKQAIYRDGLAKDALYNCAIAFLKLEQDDSACFYLERIRHTAEAKVLIDSFCK